MEEISSCGRCKRNTPLREIEKKYPRVGDIKEISSCTPQNKGFRNKTWETGRETKDFRSKPGKQEAKQRIPEENLGNRKQNKGFQNKTWETGSDTKDFRSKSGKQEAKQRISEQNLGIRSTKPGRKTMDFLNWIELGWLGWTWVDLSRPGLTWVHLDLNLMDLYGIDLAYIGLGWIGLDVSSTSALN